MQTICIYAGVFSLVMNIILAIHVYSGWKKSKEQQRLLVNHFFSRYHDKGQELVRVAKDLINKCPQLEERVKGAAFAQVEYFRPELSGTEIIKSFSALLDKMRSVIWESVNLEYQEKPEIENLFSFFDEAKKILCLAEIFFSSKTDELEVIDQVKAWRQKEDALDRAIEKFLMR